ncbi:MAG: T9SS type A sorting domain-containing protein [Bacteroidetes bacterium]|nr:T9SS type A sorting domain-containing protein [Bacteroidota bacterium]
MRKQLLTILSIFSYLLSSAQTFGNEWINYNQTYFTIKVSEKGIHRIGSTALNQYGLNFIDPNNFKLYRDGQQVPIYVNESGGNTNYIEFYGYPNDGKLDTKLYRDTAWQMHDRYSLFTDEAIYYLTWNTNAGNRILPASNDLTNLPPKETSFNYTSQLLLNNAFSSGKTEYVGSTALINSIFDIGEGYYHSAQFNNSTTTRSYSVPTPNAVAGNNADLYAVAVSWSGGAHSFNIKSGNNTLGTYQFNDYTITKANLTIPASEISVNTDVTFQANNTTSGTNRNNAALIEINYKRNYDFNGLSQFEFEIEGTGAKQYLEIQNFDEQSTYPILYDLTNKLLITSVDAPGSSSHRFALPAAIGKRKLVIRANNSANYVNVATLTQMNFVDYSSIGNQGDYIILTYNGFMNTNTLNQYVSHRQSILGGSHNVVKVDIEQLYHQFGWGIDKHPQAVRSFIKYIQANWTIEPKYLFIVGKGREYAEFRNNASARAACLVPTFGNPGSDVLLAADTMSSAPNIAIGRLAARQESDIQIYLDKIIEYDQQFYNVGDPYQTVANKIFMKNLVHLSGGINAQEQSTFKNYLLSYENTAKDTLWGVKVESINKNTNVPIQTLASQRITDRINNGVSLITFFGHSYAGGFDINFDDPENYNNEGKYPVVLANGCNAGIIHNSSISLSERFVIQDNKGAIAYLSTTDLSASGSLNIYSSNFYKNLSRSQYATSLGEIVKETVQSVEDCCGSTMNMMVCQEMTLHGDPAIPFNQYSEPDYDIEEQYVYFTPNNISTSLDSFEIKLGVYNLGKAINDSFNVEVTRIYPGGNQEVNIKRFKAPYYLDTLSFSFPVSGQFSGLGLNKFNIHVDVDDEIQNELSETNNYLLNQVELFIGSDEIFPIYPYEFAIVPNQGVTLKASTGNPFEPEKWYVYEIDTTELFNSPIKLQERIFMAGGVVPWTPALTMQDSTVYYWRVSPDSISGGTYKWKYSSFIYIQDEYPGWNQSHYYQWLKDDYQNIYLDTDREFKFISIPKEIGVQTGLYPNLAYQEMKWTLDGAKMHNWRMNNCGGGVGFPNGLSIAVINNLTGLPMEIINNSTTSSYGPYGNIHCVGLENTVYVANFRAYGTTPSNHPTPGVPWSDVIINFLNGIPNDYYVVIYSINDPSYAAWSINLINYLNSLGCSVNNSTSGPMTFVYQKNNVSFPPINTIGNTWSDIINTNFQINGTWSSGNFESPLIGPAVEWGSFHWRFKALENPTQDQQSVNIIGIDNNDIEQTLATIPTTTLDTIIDFISAQQYPYLKLKLNATDNTTRTPTQPIYWRLIYDKAPEAAINPNKYFSVNKDTLMQGEIWNMAVALENVTEFDMDSMSVKNAFTYANNSTNISYNLLKPLPAFDTLHLTFDANTVNSNYLGANSLTIEANPYEQNHQLEQFHFNNFATVNFNVNGDNINPMLDVSFDGIKIMDGDLVSAKPEIVVQLKDENLFLALDDTSLISIYFRYLGENGSTQGALERVSYNDINVQFIPAQSTQKNEAKVIMKREFPLDGTYELVIRSSDKTGNYSSGTDNRLIDLVYYDYKISFEVENQSRISNVLNYPNPFTTRTQFVFTLTGSEVPDFFQIQIMNIKGTVVKTIDRNELGNLHIGVNRTEYWWDGKDEYGDVLANGVYFYKVKTSLNNESIDSYGISEVDKFFKKGIGKMVLIR